MSKIDLKKFEAFWGFSYDDVIAGTVGYSYENWFSALEKAVDKLKLTGNEADSTKTLTYMACVAAAQDTSARDLSEKTFPHFNLAIAELQKSFEAFSWMIAALHKREFRACMARGLSNVEASREQKKKFSSALKHSFVPKVAKRANIDIEW